MKYEIITLHAFYAGEEGTVEVLSVTSDPELLEPTVVCRAADGTTPAYGCAEFMERFPEEVSRPVAVPA
jgi:hypothetical protein